MFSCTWVHFLNVPDGSRGFIELSEMDHGKEHRHLCEGEWLFWRTGIKPEARCECIFLKCVLVYIFGQLMVPPSVLA